MQERQKTGMLLGLVGLVFGSALGGDFVWDDRALTLANPAHLNGKDLDKITVNEHTKFSKLFTAWRTGNIEKL